MAKIRDGSTYLGNHLCANDYYSENEKVSGVWQGELARAWDIEGQRIEAGDTRFENLRVGLTPDGEEKLTQRGGGEVRFYDFQCAAAKSVLVQSMLDPRLAEAHERAAKVAFSELERFAARQVQGKAAVTLRQREETGKVCAAVFRHDASRELDPQLHSHHVVANVTLGKDGKRYSLETREMVEAIRYAGKAYQNELAKAAAPWATSWSNAAMNAREKSRVSSWPGSARKSAAATVSAAHRSRRRWLNLRKPRAACLPRPRSPC